MPNTEAEVKAAINTMLDIFGGVDGGVQFANFYHGILPALIAESDKNPENEIVNMALKSFITCAKIMRLERL